MSTKKLDRRPLMSRLRGRGESSGKDLTAPTVSSKKGQFVSPDRSSIVSEDTHVRGDIASPGMVHINGTLEGDVRAEKIIIGRHGRVRGNCRARGISIAGAASGELLCEELRVFDSGIIDGTIQCERIDVSAGAELNTVMQVSDTDELPEMLLISGSSEA